MLIAVTSFIGSAPRVNPKRLPPAAAQLAVNVDFTDGALGAIRQTKLAHTFVSPVSSIYKDGATWLGFSGYVNVVRGPVAQDRLYYTDDGGVPKMRVAGVVYNLALPAPVSAPTTSNLSAPGSSPENVLYAYTWVTQFGEESQPSPLSTALPYTAGVVQRIDGFAATPAGRGITHRRIYRSQTSITGATELFFVTEIPVGTTSYDYNAATTPLGEAITTKDFDPPPATLSGLTQLPNGMMAAFSGRELYFCEPYQPHAWPEKYVQAVNSPIIGLAAFGSSVAVLTTEAPFVFQGLAPDQMVSEVVEAGMPCLAGRGIVDTGFAALYPSTDGIILIGEGRRENITDAIFSRDQWSLLNPSSIIAGRFKGQYVFIHNSTSFDVYDMGTPSGWGGLLEDTFQTDGPALVNPEIYTEFDFGGPFSSFGAQTISWIDAYGTSQTGLITSTSYVPIAMFSEPSTEKLFLLDADGLRVFEWMAAEEARLVALWRSKRFSSTTAFSPGAFYVQTEARPDITDTFKARVYGDGVQLAEITVPNAIHRLPAADLYTDWEIEIETTIPVLAAYIAESPDEIMMALQ